MYTYDLHHDDDGDVHDHGDPVVAKKLSVTQQQLDAFFAVVNFLLLLSPDAKLTFLCSCS